ncbi:hypothetical protein GCM10027275_35040 [Rhabdobacter roseus]|uniref:NADPH-dependent ferric siderophore reductase n=1 Tax=Rhabdobacter roseus TaxID=1655419 RepID=A0A840TQT5_9BACT|nr:siderophore-interacting protein [Rhabdobacter roseus]MBB5285275.1 NADPH-dependent ferric siderophore reductase [Rhabdobacter roseus]
MPRIAKWVGDAMESLLASKIPLMQVTETSYLNPSIKKIRFSGNLSGMNFQLGYAVAIRVSDTEFRNYTASFSDVATGTLELLIHLHGSAPGSQFMTNLKPGDEVRISMPRGQKQYDPLVKQQLLFGDETSLALACAFQPVLKKGQHEFQFYFELDEENRQVPDLLGLENYTVFSKKDTFRSEQRSNEVPLFETSRWKSCWQASNYVLTGNGQSVQTFRKALKNNHARGRIFTKGYWLEGKTGL